MPHYVYILQSQVDLSYYKGYSENPTIRLIQHNNKDSSYTSTKVPWSLVYLESCETKTIALKRERALKKYSTSQIENLIYSGRNIVNEFK